MNVRVFVQNEAGSDQKHYHDEKTLEWIRVVTVSRRYPFPYGFIVGTTADDDCNVDCFVLTDEPLKTGQLVECLVAGLMEQFEDGHEDHNVLAVPSGSTVQTGKAVEDTLSEFVLHVFEHVPGKRINVGRFLDASEAQSHIEARLDDTSDIRPPS